MFDSDTGFGNESNPDTNCVITGPFREDVFEVTSANGSTSCLTRQYQNYTFFNRNILDMALGANSFEEYHNFVQLFVSVNIRCFIGGELCSTNAASDPLLLLHLARLDLLVQEWQDRDNSNLVVQPSTKDNNLTQTLDPSLRVSDFCFNEKLAYETCVRYAPLDPMGGGGGGSGDIHCAPLDQLSTASGSLSGGAELYITRTCENT